MLFNSYIFIFAFLPVTLLLFFLIGHYNRQAARFFLLVASIVFYGWSDYHLIFLLAFSIIVNFIINVFMIHAMKMSVRQKLLAGGVMFNLGMLGYFKYTDFFFRSLNSVFDFELPYLNIILPIGISFFTFTQIAFLVDNYRARVKSFRFVNYALFVTYFPHLIAGPIIHHKEVMPQLDNPSIFRFNYRNAVLALTLFSIGLFKKSVIADTLVAWVNPVFDLHVPHLMMIDAWMAALAYTLELYFDFSAYSDMAIALSLFLGIKLPINFYSPYQSVNIITFWRRWNITLSRFLRDYLYIPLGGNRKGSCRRYINLLITMLMGGLWHGAGWTFVVWGLLHGIYLCINHSWITCKNYMGIRSSSGWLVILLSRILTFISVVIAWVFFRAPDFSKASQILRAMFFEKVMLPSYWHLPAIVRMILEKCHIGFVSRQMLISHEAIVLIAALLLAVWCLPNPYQLLSRYSPALFSDHEEKIKRNGIEWRPTFVWNFYMAALFVAGIVSMQASSVFLYFRF